MEIPVKKLLFTVVCIFAASEASLLGSESSSLTCAAGFAPFLLDLNSQCPFFISGSFFPIQVDEESLERAINSSLKNEYTAVLFYASWCPFSSILLSKYSTLSSMYPHIKHLLVEQSAVLPSVFSRYGIHSVPALLIIEQETQTRYHGPKDLTSLTNFYKTTTGLDPIINMVDNASSDFKSTQKPDLIWNKGSLKEIFEREPFLLLSTVFVFLRAIMFFFPDIVSRIKAIWTAYIPRLNMGILGESKQLIGCFVHLIDMKRIWSRKTRNFRNARVLASSLASVSLGETTRRD